MRLARWWIGGCVLVAALTLGAAGSSFAQYDYSQPKAAAGGGLQTELTTALTHAGFAAKYEALQEVTTHLHHVVNCIVGPNDKMYNTAAGNPCQGQGNGILADIQSGTGKNQQYYMTWWVAYVANQATVMKSLPEAKAAAHVAIDVLTDVQKMK